MKRDKGNQYSNNTIIGSISTLNVLKLGKAYAIYYNAGGVNCLLVNSIVDKDSFEVFDKIKELDITTMINALDDLIKKVGNVPVCVTYTDMYNPKDFKHYKGVILAPVQNY